MKRLRLLRWSGNVLSPGTRPTLVDSPILALHQRYRCQCLSTTPASTSPLPPIAADNFLTEEQLTRLPSPPIAAARTSAKLSALHSRLHLSNQLPLESLARTLVHPSADSSPRFNNDSLAILGRDLLSYYTSEFIIAQYPRLPLAVVFAAMYAYVGPKALTSITREWGVDYAAHPGGEVDPGYLQFARAPPEPQGLEQKVKVGPETVSTSYDLGPAGWRRGISNRAVYADEFGEQQHISSKLERPEEPPITQPVTAERACMSFVRALVGTIYLHNGRAAAKQFYRNNFMSRQLNMAALFQFRHPTRDLSRLCAREGFRSPVARIISETGRASRHPVFIVGVFSGSDKLGEGAGSSLDEAKTRAAVAALKGWYLYSPLEFRVPSETEEPGAAEWKPIYVDSGDIVV